jgi:hypothetical protein
MQAYLHENEIKGREEVVLKNLMKVERNGGMEGSSMS